MKRPWKIIIYILAALVGAVFALIIISIIPIPGNYKVLTVLSGSMEPAIKTGSIIFVKPLPINYYKVNDVITFLDPTISEQPITHRIIEINEVNEERYFKVKGDANSAADWSEVSKENIAGKILFSIPFLGYLLNFAKQPLGFVLLIWTPAVIIIWEEVGKIKGEISKNKKMQAVQEVKSVPVAGPENLEIKKEIDSVKKLNKEEASEKKKSVKRTKRRKVKNVKIDEKKS